MEKFKYYLYLIVKNNQKENIDGESDKLFKLMGENILDSDNEKLGYSNNEIIIINTESENSTEVDESENNK